jgi:hypothetical protein
VTTCRLVNTSAEPVATCDEPSTGEKLRPASLDTLLLDRRRIERAPGLSAAAGAAAAGGEGGGERSGEGLGPAARGPPLWRFCMWSDAASMPHWTFRVRFSAALTAAAALSCRILCSSSSSSGAAVWLGLRG